MIWISCGKSQISYTNLTGGGGGVILARLFELLSFVFGSHAVSAKAAIGKEQYFIIMHLAALFMASAL